MRGLGARHPPFCLGQNLLGFLTLVMFVSRHLILIFLAASQNPHFDHYTRGGFSLLFLAPRSRRPQRYTGPNRYGRTPTSSGVLACVPACVPAYSFVVVGVFYGPCLL